MSKAQGMTLTEKILWRVLFWSGLLSMITGTGLAITYVNNVTQVQAYLIVGFTFIVLGMALMATGYLVSQGRIRIQNRQSFLGLQPE